MSVIAARVYNDRIVIASDSIVVKESLKRTNFKKLQKINNIIVGGCGVAEELALFFEFVRHTPSPEPNIAGLQSYMLQFANMKEYYTKETKSECTYLLIVEGKLFEIEGMFVQEVVDYTAIGEGEDYALAALYLGHTVEEAVKVACDLCCFVSEPIIQFNYPHN